VKQKAVIKFCVKLKKTATETFEMLKSVYGEECLSRTSVFEWHKRHIEAQKLRMQKSLMKTMLTAFFLCQRQYSTRICGQTGHTVNQVYYLEVLKRLGEEVKTETTQLFANNSWILYHDNAPSHTALSVREFLASKQITVLEHHP
jgi:hypothetical protein